VTAGIILSRLAGLARQRIAAHYFGTSVTADVLAAAFRVGNITQNLLGEGTLSASFIPVYAKLRGEGRAAAAAHFARSALGILLVVVLVISALGVVGAPLVTWMVAAGFEGEKLAMTVRVVRVAFPMTGLLVLSAWALGVLNAHRRFFLPYAAPVAWNLAQIAAMVVFGSWLSQRDEPLAMAVAWGAFAGAALQLTLLLPACYKLLGSLRPRFDTQDAAVREAGRRLPGALMGRGVIQLSGLVDTLLVSFLGAGANATFSYAQTLYLLPMSLLGTGEAAAALPEMARATAETDVERRNADLRRQLGGSLARVVVLTAPAMVALVIFGGELVTLLLQTGDFGPGSTERVREPLAAYGFALLANASGRIFATTSYALGDTRGPARTALARVVASTLISLALMRSFGVLGVVLGAVIAAWVEAFALGIRVRAAIGGLDLQRVPIVRVALLAAACAGAGVAARAALSPSLHARPLGAAIVLAAFSAAFAIGAPALRLLNLGALLRRR
jgi:putative peptidoglycan lipid II flippase